MKKCISLILALMLVLTVLTPAYAAEALIGDANSDNNVNNVDAMLILQHAVGLLTADKLNVSVCDVNGDGSVNNVDAMRVLQYAVGLLKKCEIQGHDYVDGICSLCGEVDADYKALDTGKWVARQVVGDYLYSITLEFDELSLACGYGVNIDTLDPSFRDVLLEEYNQSGQGVDLIDGIYYYTGMGDGGSITYTTNGNNIEVNCENYLHLEITRTAGNQLMIVESDMLGNPSDILLTWCEDDSGKALNQCRWVARGAYGEDMIREHVLRLDGEEATLSPVLWTPDAEAGGESQVIDGKTYYLVANLGEPVRVAEEDGIVNVMFYYEDGVFMRLERTAGNELTVIEVENQMVLTSGIEVGTVFYWDHYVTGDDTRCQYCGEVVKVAPPESCSHEWVEADYQNPKTCSLCGATEGTPLVPDFEKYGLEINVKENVTYPYVTVCYENHNYKTTGEFKIYDYRTFESDAEHPAMDGYEWRAFTVDILFNDENAWYYGMSVRACFENYYAIEDWDNSYNEATGTYTARFNGVDYTECCSIKTGGLEDWVGQERLFRADYYFRVPVGYDGLVYGFYDASTEWEDGMYVYDVADENTLFFRLN